MESAGLELGRTLLLRTHRLARRALNQLSYQDRQCPQTRLLLSLSLLNLNLLQKTSFRFKGKSSLSNTLIHSQDIVSPIRCFAWPPAAMEWKTRQRKHGWPDERTIASVVVSGCDVVPVAHNDNRMDEYQWRISFSKTEVILMNSLTPGQQYIYHMLRYFVKIKLLDKDLKNSDKIVSMYTIKTLILWQSEKMPIHWFIQNTSYEICLLRILLNWLLDVDYICF